MAHHKKTMQQSEKDAALKRKQSKTDARKARHVLFNTVFADDNKHRVEELNLTARHAKRKSNHGNGNPNRNSVLLRTYERGTSSN